MTLEAVTPRVEYVEDGSTLIHAVPFQFNLKADIVAWRVDPATFATTLMGEGTDYTVTGGGGAAGSITKTSAGTAGTIVRIERATPRAQIAEYPTGGSFPAITHEKLADQLAAISQEQDTRIDVRLAGAIRSPDGDVIAEMPAAPSRSLRFMQFTSPGTAISLLTALELARGLGPDMVIVLGSGFKGDPGSPGEGYATRAAMALAGNTASNLDDAFLTEGVRAGKFIFYTVGGYLVATGRDLLAEVAGDADQGKFVAAERDATGAAGAWARQPERAFISRWFDALGDAAADDGPALDAALTVSAGKALTGIAGDNYLLTTWAGHSPLGALNLDFGGIALTGPGTSPFLTGIGEVAIDGGDFSDFSFIAQNIDAAADPVKLKARGGYYHGLKANGAAVFQVSAPIDTMHIADAVFEGNEGTQIAIGTNLGSYDRSREWEGAVIDNPSFINIAGDSINLTSTATQISILNYGAGTRVRNPRVDGNVGGKNQETAAVYNKGPYFLVDGAYIRGVDHLAGGSGTNYGINFKGIGRVSDRGAWVTATSYVKQDLVLTGGIKYYCLTPHTSGTFATDLAAGKWGVAAAPGNASGAVNFHLIGDNAADGVAVQLQSSELFAGPGHIEAYHWAFELSGFVSNGRLTGVHGRGVAGDANSRFLSGNMFGSGFQDIDNNAYGYADALRLTVNTGDTFERFVSSGGISQCAGGYGHRLIGTDPDSIRSVMLSNRLFDGCATGGSVHWTNVKGGRIETLIHTNLVAPERPFTFITCKDIFIRDAFQRRLTSRVTPDTGDAAAGAAQSFIEVPVSEDNHGAMRVLVEARKSDGSKSASIENRCQYKYEAGAGTTSAGTESYLGTAGVTLAFDFGSNRVRARVTCPAGEDWDATCRLLEMTVD